MFSVNVASPLKRSNLLSINYIFAVDRPTFEELFTLIQISHLEYYIRTFNCETIAEYNRGLGQSPIVIKSL